jgi:hypothetical protein
LTSEREPELETARAVQAGIDSHLKALGIEPRDGLKQRTSQTGEDYKELIVHADGITDLTQALAGAVAAFGSPGSRCYWRVRPELEQRPGEGGRIRAYARFLMTTKAEQ